MKKSMTKNRTKCEKWKTEEKIPKKEECINKIK